MSAPDFLVTQDGPAITLNALSSSPAACQLLLNMQVGTMENGTRYLTEDDCVEAFDLIDTACLTMRIIA